MAYFEHRLPDQLWDPPHIQPTSLSQVEIIAGESQAVIVRHGDTSHYQATFQE